MAWPGITDFSEAVQNLTLRRHVAPRAATPAPAARPIATPPTPPTNSSPPPNPSVPAVPTRDVLDRLEEAARIWAAALKRSAASGELTRVALGVVATVAAVIAVMVAAVALVVARSGW